MKTLIKLLPAFGKRLEWGLFGTCSQRPHKPHANPFPGRPEAWKGIKPQLRKCAHGLDAQDKT